MSCRLIGVAFLALPLAMAGGATQLLAQAAPAADEKAPPITVQIAPPPISVSAMMIGLSNPLGAQAVSGKPVCAEFVTEHHQSFADGNRISRSTASKIYRDADGRIRRESQLSLPGISAAVTSTFITIVDRQVGYGYVLNPQEMIAHRYALNGAGPSYVAHLNARAKSSALLPPDSKQSAGGTAAPEPPAPADAGSSRWHPHAFASYHGHPSPDATGSSDSGNPSALNSSYLSDESAPTGAPVMRIDQPFLAAPNPVRTENLGEQIILGVRAQGTRVITTLPAGQIGNDRPIDIVSEQWFSPELELVLRSMHNDPWAGEFTTTVTRISRGNQPASLFEVPVAYKIIDATSEGERHVLDGHGGHTPGLSPR
jgi:hypothetical protein